jgi:hypothetical protein
MKKKTKLIKLLSSRNKLFKAGDKEHQYLLKPMEDSTKKKISKLKLYPKPKNKKIESLLEYLNPSYSTVLKIKIFTLLSMLWRKDVLVQGIISSDKEKMEMSCIL